MSLDKKAEMFKIICEMMQNAYAPYSNYRVGACVEAEDGTLFGGCNVENLSFGLTICAERNAVSSMIAAGKKQITSIAIASSSELLCFPCGACLQYIREFSLTNTPIHLFAKNQGYIKTVTLNKLLPALAKNFKLQQRQIKK